MAYTTMSWKRGDSLPGHRSPPLGSEEKWKTLFRANRGAARLDTSRPLTDPDLVTSRTSPLRTFGLPHVTAHHSATTIHHPGPSTDKPRKKLRRGEYLLSHFGRTDADIPFLQARRLHPPRQPHTSDGKGPSSTISVYETNTLIGAASRIRRSRSAVLCFSLGMHARTSRRAAHPIPILADPVTGRVHRGLILSVHFPSGWTADLLAVILLVDEVHRRLAESGIAAVFCCVGAADAECNNTSAARPTEGIASKSLITIR